MEGQVDSLIADLPTRRDDAFVVDRAHLAPSEVWPNDTIDVVDVDSPTAVCNATLEALGTIHLDKSPGADGHHVDCSLLIGSFALNGRV